MMEKYRCSRLLDAPKLLFVAVALLLAVAPAAAATPLEVIKAMNDQVLSIYQKHKVVNAAVEALVFATIDPVTDYPTIASSAIDQLCTQLAADQCTSFKETFTRLLRVFSIKKLGWARAGRFEYLGEKVTGESAVVRSIAYFNNEQVPLDYSLSRRGETWVIVNYVVDEIDTVKNYRKQFRKFLEKKSVAQLKQQLEKKIASLEAEN